MAKRRTGQRKGGTGRAGKAAEAPPRAAADSGVPEFCGFSCPHSDFPPPETAGLCRTMAAVYCTKLRRLVDKNAPCRWRGGK